MSQRKRLKSLSQRSGRRRGARRAVLWWILGMLVVISGVAAAWLASRGGEPASSVSELPGPAGGRDVAQDVHTLVGKRAPSFTLSAADGQTHEIRPGQGRPTVLIFHMGIT